MTRRTIALATLLAILALGPACGRREGPEPAWNELRRAIEAEDGETLYELMPAPWQRLYVAWAEDMRERTDPDFQARGMGLTREEYDAMSARDIVHHLLRVGLKAEGRFHYSAEYVKEIRSTKIDRVAPDRARVVTQIRSERIGPRFYEFVLRGGRWYWRPPMNIPADILRRAG